MRNAVLSIFFCLAVLDINAQVALPNAIIDSLPESRFYFVGQLHGNKANAIIEKELLFSLNARRGVQFDIIEYPHSVAFLLNQYLQTGEDSILSFINAASSFSLVKAVRKYNGAVPAAKQIRFYGVDFENREQGRFTRKTVDIIGRKAALSQKDALFDLCTSVAGSQGEELKKNLLSLKKYLNAYPDRSRASLGEYYTDLYLVANAQFDFSPGRDKAMIDNFYFLYAELSRRYTAPSFIASFGTGHINPANKNGFASRLNEDENSPLRGKISVLGVQYINCVFKNEGYKDCEGSLNLSCNKKSIAALLQEQDRTARISFLPRAAWQALHCNRDTEKFSGVLVVRNFSAVPNWGD